MHTVWKGSISFGLVNIPVRMFTATEERDVRFRMLHRECHTPIRYAKTCPNCNREVEGDEIVRGYEYEKGHFVMIRDEDLEAIAPETRKAIEIVDFVDLKEIDPIYFDKSYYLSPQETGEKAYALLRAAMERTGRIAVARVTLRNRERLAVVRIYGNCIVMETIHYPDEVRPVAQVPALPGEDTALGEKELAMAEELINSMTSSFDPAKYTDEYRAELHRLIEKKLEGQEIAAAPAAPRTNVIDLMQALKASLAAVEDGKPVVPAKVASDPANAAGPEKTPASEERVVVEDPAQGESVTTRKLRRKKAQS